MHKTDLQALLISQYEPGRMSLLSARLTPALLGNLGWLSLPAFPTVNLAPCDFKMIRELKAYEKCKMPQTSTRNVWCDTSNKLHPAPFSEVPRSPCFFTLVWFLVSNFFRMNTLNFLLICLSIFPALLRYNWHIKLCKSKLITCWFDRFIHCKMITTLALANTSVMHLIPISIFAFDKFNLLHD